MNITLFVEHLCNLRCTYCYTGEKFKKTMSQEMLEASVELAFSDQPDSIEVSFFGGEPLLRFELLKQAVCLFKERAKQEGDATGRSPSLGFVVNTNATLLSDEIINWMKEERFFANVSLDGPQEVHDRVRIDAAGQGSYRQTRDGLCALAAAGIPFQLNAVVSPQTAADMGATAQELLRYGSVKNHLAADLSAEWSDEAIAQFHSGARHAAKVWGSAFREGKTPRLEPFERKVLSHVLGGCAGAARCNLNIQEVTVAPSGHLYSCAQMVGEDNQAQNRIGHVLTGIDYAAVSKMRVQKEKISEVCGRCDLRSRCSSDCGCRQLSATGKLGAIDGIMCETEEAFINAADLEAEALVRDDNEGFLSLVYRTPRRLRKGASLSPLRTASQVESDNSPRRLQVLQ